MTFVSGAARVFQALHDPFKLLETKHTHRAAQGVLSRSPGDQLVVVQLQSSVPSCDRYTGSAKASSPQSAMQCFLFQIPGSLLFLKVFQLTSDCLLLPYILVPYIFLSTFPSVTSLSSHETLGQYIQPSCFHFIYNFPFYLDSVIILYFSHELENNCLLTSSAPHFKIFRVQSVLL